MTVWNDNAAAFATTSETAVRAYRNKGVREAVRALRIGQPELARAVIFASVEKQARLSGIRNVHLPRSQR